MERGIIKQILLYLALFLSLNTVKAYNTFNANDGDYVTFKVAIEREDIGVVETICFDETIFLNLANLMVLLGYPHQWEAANKKFAACCPTKKNCFIIQHDSIIKGGTVSLFPDSALIYDDGQLYLHSTYLSSLLKIESSIIFQSLKIIIKDAGHFPVLLLRDQEVRRKRMQNGRENITLQHVDTLPLSYARINSFGYALAVNSSKEGFVNNYNTAGSMNAELLKGSLHLNYSHSGGKSSNTPDQFTFKQSYSLKHKWLKQLSFFRDYSDLTLNLDGYGSGVYLSNDNTSFFNRRYFLYKGRSRPNADLEIYNNNTLVSFITANSLGYYEIVIPVNNGINNISAVTFNDYGESVSDHKTIYMPLDMEPHKKFRYALSSGYTDNGTGFTGLTIAYGITPFITATALSEATYKHGKVTTLVGAGLKFALGTALQGGIDYFHRMKYTLNLTGNIKHILGYSISYEKFEKDQKIVLSNPLQKLQMDLTSEIPIAALPNSATLSIRQNKYKSSQSFTTNFRWNVFLQNISASIYTATNAQKSFSFDNLNLGAQLGYRITNRIYDDLNYSYYHSRNDHQIRNRIQYQLASKLSSNLNIEYQTGSKNISFEIGITYRFPWMTVGSNARTNNAQWGINNSISGGINRHRNNAFDFSNQSLSGSSLHVALYVDKNGNNKYEKKEKIISNGKVILKTGANISRKESGIYFRNIPPEHAFKLIVPRQSFSDISWQIMPIEKTIYLAPYQSRSFYFPVKVISEVAGSVFSISDGEKKFYKNVVVKITNINDGNSIKTYTDDWGSYDYFGLTAGAYEITIASEHVQVIGNKIIHIEIPESEEGEQLEDLDFEVVKHKK